MKNKIGIIIICAAMAFVAIIAAFILNEQSNDFMNMEKATEEQMEVLIAGKEEKYVNVNAVTFNGYSISADKNENTLYVCQNINEKYWQGELITNDGNKLYVLYDELMDNKAEAIRQAHKFKAYSVGETEYADFDLIFTGMSTINFHTDSRDEELSTGRLVITDTVRGGIHMERPLDIYGSLKEKKKKDNLPGHINYKMELFADEHGRSYDSALFGLREDDDWELDSIMENEYAENEMLALSIWNSICDAEGYDAFKSEARYSYLFVDDVKIGLYVVRVPYDDRQLKISKTDSFYEWDTLESAQYNDPDIREFVAYSLFIQAVYAPKNLVKNKYVLEKDIGEGRKTYKLPRHLEYMFEYLPNNVTEYTDKVGTEYYSYVLEDPDINELIEQGELKVQDVCDKWKSLRSLALSNDKILELYNEQYDYLEKTGFIEACNFDVTVQTREGFEEYLKNRFSYLDRYYENEMKIPSVKVRIEDIKVLAGETEVELYRANDGYYAFLPAFTDIKKAQLLIPDKIDIYFKDDISGGFEENKKYSFVANADGERVEDTLTLMKSEKLPAMFIETKSKSMSFILSDSEHYEPGSVDVINADGTKGFSGVFKKLKGHGRSSWVGRTEKKSFNMILNESEAILDAGSSRHWVLMANSRDGSFLRNKLTYDLAEDMGMHGSPKCDFCDLYINGKYVGNYLLCQKFEISEDVLDIADLDKENESANPGVDIKTVPTLQSEGRRGTLLENNPEDITGGYLIQGNRSRKYVSGFFHSDRDYRIEIKFPEYPTVEETDYIYEYFQLAEDAVYAKDGINPTTGLHYSEYIDVESFAEKYLVEEFSKNVDAVRFSSYYYKDKGGKLFAGPVWDYDAAYGNVKLETISKEMMDPLGQTRLIMSHKMEDNIFNQLLNHEDFVSVVTKLYEEEFAPLIDELCESGIDRYTEYIAASAEMDDIRYQNEIDPGGTMEKNKSYKKYIPVLKSFIQKRKNFMDEILLENVKYVRIYLMNGEIEFDCINVKAGEKISPDGETPANEEGLSFAGWYDDEGNELKDGETAVSDKTYFARWE